MSRLSKSLHLKLFKWKAKSNFNTQEAGYLIAQNEEQVKKNLLNQGFRQIKVMRNWQFNYQPSKSEICNVFNQLAMLLNAQIPLKSALLLLQENCVNLVLYQWLTSLITALNNGLSLSQALKQGLSHTHWISHEELQLIKIGEVTGNLAYICSQISENKAKNLALQRKIQKIMLYPLMVLGIALSLTLLLLLFVVPKFSEIYSSNSQSIPLFTAYLLAISQFLHNHWLNLSLVTITLSIVVKIFNPPWLKTWFHKALKHLPIFKDLLKLNQNFNFSNNLALMINAGIPLNESLNCLLTNASAELKIVLQHCLQGILAGKPFFKALPINLLDNSSRQMLKIGEQSGQLGLMLQHIAKQQEEKLNFKIDMLSQMLEPMLMVIIGGIIGLIMLGMYLPIFNMGSLV